MENHMYPYQKFQGVSTHWGLHSLRIKIGDLKILVSATSFSNRERSRASEPVSFRRENEIAIVILVRVFVRTA